MILPTERIFLGKPPNPFGLTNPPTMSGIKPAFCASAGNAENVPAAIPIPEATMELKKSRLFTLLSDDSLLIETCVENGR
jgi:hypothetical protein